MSNEAYADFLKSLIDAIPALILVVDEDVNILEYNAAAAALLGRLSKRAFIVLITNLRDEDDQALRGACELLSTRHLVLCASLREKALDAAVAAPVLQFADALRVSAAAHYLQQRDQAIKRLGIRASHLIDITPERLSLSLVNRYLDIKESGQL